MQIKDFGLHVLDVEFLKKYYINKFPRNKKMGQRLYCICFKDNLNSDIYWIIPISTK